MLPMPLSKINKFYRIAPRVSSLAQEI